MKRFLVPFIILTLICSTSKAQEDTGKIRELGISLGSNFGLRYRAGNHSNLFRITILSLYGSSDWQKSTQGTPDHGNGQGFGLNFGFEKRKGINDNIFFYYGIDLLNSYSRHIQKYDNQNTSKSWSYSPGLGFVFGFGSNLSQKVNISAEVMPSIVYTYIRNIYTGQDNIQKHTNSSIDYGLKNSGITLTLSYIIGK